MAQRQWMRWKKGKGGGGGGEGGNGQSSSRIPVESESSPPPFPITLVITPTSCARLLLHPCSLIPRQAHTRQPHNIRANFQQPIVPTAFILVADFCNFLMLLYCHLIAGGKALFLLSSPVVAALSLPCSPPPPLPPLLADHDLGRCLTGPALLQPQPLSQLNEYF